MFLDRKNKRVWQAWLRKKKGTNKTMLAAKMGKRTDRAEVKSAVELECRFCHLSARFVTSDVKVCLCVKGR